MANASSPNRLFKELFFDCCRFLSKLSPAAKMKLKRKQKLETSFEDIFCRASMSEIKQTLQLSIPTKSIQFQVRAKVGTQNL